MTTVLHAPYRKPLNDPLFIHKDSNHPPNIKVDVPKNACKRLSTNSSTKEIFDIAAPPYIEALKRDGYQNFDFSYIPKQSTQKPKKAKSRKILFCNLPWNMAVKNKIGKDFLSLVDLFKNSPQGKYLNRHTIKLSYSTMRNLKSHISASNMKKLHNKQAETPVTSCKCESDKDIVQCPVSGQCVTSNVVYSAEVKTKYSTKTYIGMTGCPFIDRWKEHRGNLRHKHQNGTKLSKYIWRQKDFGENITMKDIKWCLKTKAVPYKAGSRYCDTCLSEKTYIALSKPNDILNLRKEIVGKCPHKRAFKLKFFKPP